LPIVERAGDADFASPRWQRRLILQPNYFIIRRTTMARKEVEALLVAGGGDKHLRAKYDVPGTREEFVALAAEDGYHFTVEELDAVLKESGDVFEKNGNPAKRQIWWV